MTRKLTRITDELKSILNADNIISHYPHIKAHDKRVNLHESHVALPGFPEPVNLGDSLSRVVVEWMLGKRGLSLDTEVSQKRHLISIGSGAVTTYQNLTIWGAGVERELPGFPDFRHFFQKSWYRKLDIRAVRGPLSRDYLIKLGHQCPEVYGDPAILMPLIYAPVSTKKKHDYIVIPQFANEGQIRKDYPEERIVSMVTDDYRQVINAITSASLVYSSSLHGIILAEAYGVPAVFFRGIGKDIDFKYLDYYASTGRTCINIPSSLEEAKTSTPMPLPELKWLQEQLMEVFPYDLWR